MKKPSLGGSGSWCDCGAGCWHRLRVGVLAEAHGVPFSIRVDKVSARVMRNPFYRRLTNSAQQHLDLNKFAV
jgi:hypothetical protein